MVHQIFYSCILILILVTSNNGQTDEWLSTVNTFFKICVQRSSGTNNSFFNVLNHCVQKRALTVIDNIISKNNIPLIDGVSFLRFKEREVSGLDSTPDINTSIGKDKSETWRDLIFDRFSKIFKTHVLKINIEQLTNSSNMTDYSARENFDGIVEGRRRHNRRKNQMMPMLMMGILVMGSVLIPMGFQFLAVLGGKALILAKLALMLSSIQGLKKVATSGVNYGLYHGGSPGPDGWHDRSHHELPPPPPPPSSFNFDIPFQPYQTQAYPNF